jgi:hypothetical protein
MAGVLFFAFPVSAHIRVVVERGNFSKVFEARSLASGQTFAIKVIKKTGLHSSKV